MVTRRTFVRDGAVAAAALLIYSRSMPPAKAAQTFELTMSEDEWRKKLTPDQFAILRQSATERPFTSALLNEKRNGVFACAGCDLALFSSSTKYERNTGWPSFWAPLDNASGTEEDKSFGLVRTSVHCRRCGGHLGHVFEDGPKPTGLRYCMNGIALTFKASAA